MLALIDNRVDGPESRTRSLIRMMGIKETNTRKVPMSISSKEDFIATHMPLGHHSLKAFGALWAGWCPSSSTCDHP